MNHLCVWYFRRFSRLFLGAPARMTYVMRDHHHDMIWFGRHVYACRPRLICVSKAVAILAQGPLAQAQLL